MNEESIFIIYSWYVVLSKTQRSNVGHVRGDQFSRPRANFSRKISKKTSQTTAVSQNNLEIVEITLTFNIFLLLRKPLKTWLGWDVWAHYLEIVSLFKRLSWFWRSQLVILQNFSSSSLVILVNFFKSSHCCCPSLFSFACFVSVFPIKLILRSSFQAEAQEKNIISS